MLSFTAHLESLLLLLLPSQLVVLDLTVINLNFK